MPHETMQVMPTMLYVSQFRLSVPCLRVSGMGDYFPLRAFCKAIGLASQPQLEKVQTDTAYAEGLETFTVETAGGPQESLCLRKREVAYWLATLEPRTVRKLEERFSTTLAEFKQAVMDAADRLWWGVQSEPPSRALQVSQDHFIGYLHCRRCGARHRLEAAVEGTWTWEIDEE